ncbi:MAG: peptide/nickel transport system permease protein [Frankiales bacterium]|jgi:peptide/nickel transport system permease protein|nr:peptide/nickel transport system permease protein [Frankiales bacterium]
MARLILVRVFHAVLSMALLTLFVFFLVRLTGDPAALLLPDLTPPDVMEAFRVKLGLNEPLYIQYGIFMSNLLHGDLGRSFVYAVPVSDLIAQRLPNTLILAVSGLVTTLVVGLPLGVLAAYKRGGRLDVASRWLAVVGQSAPSFWIGLLLILLFSVRLHILPSGGIGGLPNLILPTLTIAVKPLAGLVRLTRSSMIEVLETDYVKFLRLKGLPERQILWKHALRNGGLTALTFVGVLTADLMTGSVVSETVFAWPGLGWLMVTSITSGDFAVVQAVVLMFSLIYIVINLLVDLLYGVLNPRLR